jgi:hypothetical protein
VGLAAALLAAGGFPAETAGPGDAESLRGVAPEIVDVTRRPLDKVRAGELGNPPRDAAPADTSATGDGGEPVGIREGWL